MLGFIATDMYLPAFKAMEVDFATGPEQIALSLTVFLVGLALGQLMWGVVSDKFGHRNTLAVGLIIFALASFGLSVSDDAWELLVLRFVQAIGVCAPAVIWQAIVIRRYASMSQQIFATIMPLVALSPAIAPQIGVFLTDHFGWRSIFVVLTIVGGLLVMATMAREKDVTQHQQGRVLGDIKSLFGSRAYMGNVIMFACCSAAFFAYLTGVSEIMANLGYQSKDIGLSFIPQTIAFMVGGYLGKVYVRKFGDELMLRVLITLFSTAAIILFIASQCHLTSIWPTLAPFCLLALANGAIYPIVVNRALTSAQNSPATAVGLQNSLQICISSLASALVAVMASQAQSVTGIAIVLSMGGVWLGYMIQSPGFRWFWVAPDVARLKRS
ncbi:Bcr/CflA family multidrug efflux MFS transporter [Sansalvadorimonas verongulae]|nr:Bcr/CflA family multidrug efflux MFS transporter [Sansalvadorimonas verongulae]